MICSCWLSHLHLFLRLQGAVDTSFLAKHESQLLGAHPVAPPVLALAAVAFLQIAVQRAQVGSLFWKCSLLA